MTDDLKELLTFLKFPSISTDSKHAQDIQDCSAWLSEKLQEMGLQSTIYPTELHPIVVAKNPHQAGKKTVLIYGHYDVQPVDPVSLWKTAPFEPDIRDGKIWCRGAADNKGQMYAHVCGVRELLKQGDLPVNLIFLFEGEEEIGSIHLGDFLIQHREELRCDVVAISDTGMVAPKTPTLSYGLRGIVCCEVTLRGPQRDLHSGLFGGAVANPATAIAQLVSSLHDENGKVTVAGFYDDVRPLQSWERDMWQTVPGVSDQDYLQVTGSPSLFGEAGFSSAERTWGRPTAEVNGIGGGYQGEGSKTVLPAEAFAKFSFRIVPDQKPEDILQKVEAHFRKHCPAGVEIEVHLGHSGAPYATDPHSPFGKAAQNALLEAFGKEPVLIRDGGSIPIVQTFRDVLGVDTLLLGLALPDAQIHSPNENFPIENFEAGIRMSQALLRELAR